MKSQNRFLFTLILLFKFVQVFCKQDDITISILTVDPGKEIYSIFGHTAIRIQDHRDRVYNFGTFNFDDPYFVIKFIRGNLNYYLSVTDYYTFIQSAQEEKRKVSEQILDLTDVEKRQFFEKLRQNYRSPERYYRYDFFYDNCATRVRDYIFNDNLHPLPSDSAGYYGKTFRQLIKPYLQNRYWLKLGINLALGPEADKKAGFKDYMFLPDYIRITLVKSEIVKKTIALYEPARVGNAKSGLSSWFSAFILTALITCLSFFNSTRRPVYFAYLALVGITGLILLISALISVNNSLQWNFNILWTFPALIVLIIKKPNIRCRIEFLYAFFLFSLIFVCPFLRQELSLTFIPWILTLFVILVRDITPFPLSLSSLQQFFHQRGE